MKYSQPNRLNGELALGLETRLRNEISVAACKALAAQEAHREIARENLFSPSILVKLAAESQENGPWN